METYAEQNVASVRQLHDRDLVRPKSLVSDIHVAYDLGWMTNYYRGTRRPPLRHVINVRVSSDVQPRKTVGV